VDSNQQAFAEFTDSEFIAYSGENDVIVKVGDMNHILKATDIEPIKENGTPQEVLEASDSQDTQPWDSAQRIEK